MSDTTLHCLAQRAGISNQHAWGLIRATIGVGKVAAKRLHDTLGIPTDELLAVAPVPAHGKRTGRKPLRSRPKRRPSTPPQE